MSKAKERLQEMIQTLPEKETIEILKFASALKNKKIKKEIKRPKKFKTFKLGLKEDFDRGRLYEDVLSHRL